MNAVVMVTVVFGVIAFVLALYLLLKNRFLRSKSNLIERVDQLGYRLEKKVSELSCESNNERVETSKKILEILRESEEQIRIENSSVLSSGLPSIQPLKQSAVALSKRLLDLDLDQPVQNNSQSLSIVSLAVIYIRSRIFEAIRVEQIAKELGVSRSTLYEHLKECLACSAHELITVIKMQEAKKILKTEDVMVKEVAARLGYWSPYHFSSRFKTFFGVSPKQFREHYLQKKQHVSYKAISNCHRKTTSNASEAECPPQQRNTQYEGQLQQDTKDLPAGTKIDRFIIISSIGHGGMGVVYKAYDPKLNRGVALKLIRPDRARLVDSQNRLLREAQALARLSHPNVLHVYDVGTFGDQVFMTMALVEGQTLKEWLRSEKRTIDEILAVMIAAGRGLSAAHTAGLVHRDFKPSNIIVGQDGQVRVLDFGLARAVSVDGSNDEPDIQQPKANFTSDINFLSSTTSSNLLLTPLTHDGHIVGTPLYMAPEQHLGRPSDERSDQFAFCLVLYEALYGKRPFYSKTLDILRFEVIHNQVRIPPENSEVPVWLWHIIQKGLHSEPDNRYPTIESLLDDLIINPDEKRRQQIMTNKRYLFLVILLLLTIVLPIGVWYQLRYRSIELCKDTKEELEGVWDTKIRASVKNAFLETKNVYANETWERVEQNIDKYLNNWAQMRVEVCEAKYVRGTESEDLFDLRMGCLESRRQELKALTSIFVKTDNIVLEKATEATSSLTEIETCADVKALRNPYPPPKTESDRQKVATMRKKLSLARALGKTGRYQDGLALMKTLEEDSKKIDYLPIQAELQYLTGVLLEKSGRYKQSEFILYEAIQKAGDCGDNLIAAKGMTKLVFVVGVQQSRYKEGMAIGRNAKVVIALGGKNKRIESELLNYLGGLFWGKGDFSTALGYYRRSLQLKEMLGAFNQPDTAMILNNIGMVLGDQGNQKESLKYQRKALDIFEKVAGPNHPYVAMTLNNLGTIYRRREEYTKALEIHQRALKIRKQALGNEHRYVATTYHNIGLIYLDQGKPDRALDFLRKALEIWKKALGPKHPFVAYSLSSIGAVYHAQGKDDEALKYYRNSISLFETAVGSDHPFLLEPLGGIGEVLVNRHPNLAIESLERAAKICTQKTCDPVGYGKALFNLSRALFATNTNKNRAIKLARQARDIFQAEPNKHEKEQREVETWLNSHDL